MSNKESKKYARIFSLGLRTVVVLCIDKLASNLNDDQCKPLKEFLNREEVFKLGGKKVYVHMSV